MVVAEHEAGGDALAKAAHVVGEERRQARQPPGGRRVRIGDPAGSVVGGDHLPCAERVGHPLRLRLHLGHFRQFRLHLLVGNAVEEVPDEVEPGPALVVGLILLAAGLLGLALPSELLK